MASERKQWPGGIISENGLEKHPQEKKKKKKKDRHLAIYQTVFTESE